MKGEREEREPRALRGLLLALKDRDYRFVTSSPRTHAIVAGRRRTGESLRDLLGWSLPVERAALDPDILSLLEDGGALTADGALVRSRYRVSSDGADLYLHSAFPTDAADAVFFGPDSYRFAAFLRRRLDPVADVRRLVEIGAGSGVGAITAARVYPGAEIALTDINPAALRLAAINAAAAGIAATPALGSGLQAAEGRFDLVVANPPYMMDSTRRAYRHGGGRHGEQVALDWAEEALARLNPRGRLLLYSGAPIVAGEDVLLTGLRRIAARAGAALDYEEIDPDVWGEDLAQPDYEEVERIAVTGAVLTLPA